MFNPYSGTIKPILGYILFLKIAYLENLLCGNTAETFWGARGSYGRGITKRLFIMIFETKLTELADILIMNLPKKHQPDQDGFQISQFPLDARFAEV